jgi:hypothetical protein
MSMVPEGQDDQPNRDVDARADAMKAQLRKDVESWSRARNETSPRDAVEPTAAVVRPPSPKPATRARALKRAPPAAAPAGAKSKPFSMSYDGSTTAEYIQYMIDRGAK